MKVLDITNLFASIDETVQGINSSTNELEAIEKSIVELINLNHSLTGKGAEAIKSYYQLMHKPFLFKLKQILTSYKVKLIDFQNKVNSFEPDDSGYIHEEFLQSEIPNKVSEVQNFTNDVTEDANKIISSVLDIVHVELLNATDFNNHVEEARKSVTKTVSDLEDLDLENTSSLDELTGDLHILTAYIEEMDTIIGIGPRSLGTFSPLQALMNPSYSLLLGSIKSTPLNDNNGPILESHPTQSIYAFQYTTTPYQWLGLDFTSTNPKSTQGKVEKPSSYLTGGSVKEGDFTFEAGAGKSVNKWSGLDGDGQLGGSSKLSGIHAGIKHDTDIFDSSFDLEIGATEAQASIGGKSVFPLVKAGGTAYAAEISTQFDKDIDYIGRAGVKAKGEILKANAYAGVDNSSVGFGAKASVAEGEISGVLPIPLTDYNIKGTLGASAFGIGGEAKVGKEFVLDLRFLIGVKLGLSLEKE